MEKKLPRNACLKWNTIRAEVDSKFWMTSRVGDGRYEIADAKTKMDCIRIKMKNNTWANCKQLQYVYWLQRHDVNIFQWLKLGTTLECSSNFYDSSICIFSIWCSFTCIFCMSFVACLLHTHTPMPKFILITARAKLIISITFDFFARATSVRPSLNKHTIFQNQHGTKCP